jgi:hypothetical protein
MWVVAIRRTQYEVLGVAVEAGQRFGDVGHLVKGELGLQHDIQLLLDLFGGKRSAFHQNSEEDSS